MHIQCNNNTIVIDDNTTLFKLMEQKGFITKKGMAVALNNTVIPKNEWTKHTLKENDKVLIIIAAQGG